VIVIEVRVQEIRLRVHAEYGNETLAANREEHGGRGMLAHVIVGKYADHLRGCPVIRGVSHG